jgi:transcriptional regulator with XRE-family HTH domain
MELPNLRRVRERALLTQRELAAKAGLTQATVQRIESGATQARISTVRRLAAALQVDACELMGGGGEGTHQREIER